MKQIKLSEAHGLTLQHSIFDGPQLFLIFEDETGRRFVCLSSDSLAPVQETAVFGTLRDLASLGLYSAEEVEAEEARIERLRADALEQHERALLAKLLSKWTRIDIERATEAERIEAEKAALAAAETAREKSEQRQRDLAAAVGKLK